MNKTRNAPLPLGEKILKFFLPQAECESILGDFTEIYSQMALTKGKFRADIWFWAQVFKSSWRGVSVYIWWSFNMFKSYLTVAFRNLKRYKIYSFINISGLSIGIACCILILLWVNDETHYDRFHVQGPDLYRVVNHLSYGPVAQRTQGTAYPLGPAMREEISEVKDFTRLLAAGRLMVAHGTKRFYEERFYFADSSFFTMLTFPFIRGDPETALASPSAVVITQELALKYFGREDPVGQTLRTHNQNDYVISGVVENIPLNSHLQFDFIGSLERAVELGSRTHWTGWFYTTYVLLQPHSDYHTVNRKLEEWIKTKDSEAARYYLQPLANVHLYGLSGDGPIRSLSFFSFLAIFISCFGLLGLISFAAEQRTKEIGIRKVLGASVGGIVRLLAKEFLVLVIIANIIAWPVAYVAMNRWLGNFAYRADLSIEIFLFSGFLAVMIAILTVSFQSIKTALANPVKSLRYE